MLEQTIAYGFLYKLNGMYIVYLDRLGCSDDSVLGVSAFMKVFGLGKIDCLRYQQQAKWVSGTDLLGKVYVLPH